MFYIRDRDNLENTLHIEGLAVKRKKGTMLSELLCFKKAWILKALRTLTQFLNVED